MPGGPDLCNAPPTTCDDDDDNFAISMLGRQCALGADGDRQTDREGERRIYTSAVTLRLLAIYYRIKAESKV